MPPNRDGMSSLISLMTGLFFQTSFNRLGMLAAIRRSFDLIHGFDGRSLEDPEADGWRVKRDGGVFDQFSGATITPRAVVKAVHRALQYFVSHRDALFEQAPSVPAPGASEAG